MAAAVASVFSMRLVDAGMAEAAQLTPVVFMVIVGTVLVYGLTAGPVARWLGVSNPDPQGVLIAGAHALGRNMAAEPASFAAAPLVIVAEPRPSRGADPRVGLALDAECSSSSWLRRSARSYPSLRH